MMQIHLFLGTETIDWHDQDFIAAAIKAKALGVTHLLIKIADGTNYWYGSIGGWQRVLSLIQGQGIIAIPYVYSYGNTYNAASTEIGMYQTILQTHGSLILDMEVEWNGQALWASWLATALRSTPGTLYITTWADPDAQNWQHVINALESRVQVWMPQVYSDYLASVYKQQFSGLNILPIFNLGLDFGSNMVLSNVENANLPCIGFWHYRPATTIYSGIFSQILSYMKGKYEMSAPEGWTDNGSTLVAPNGVHVVLGFRAYIQNYSPFWNKENVPLRAEYAANPVLLHNPSIGGGTRQEFRDCLLWWTAEKGVVQEPFLGLEICSAYQALEQKNG